MTERQVVVAIAFLVAVSTFVAVVFQMFVL
jgi:hypothetical protein